jgi:hypothetical protein
MDIGAPTEAQFWTNQPPPISAGLGTDYGVLEKHAIILYKNVKD